MNVPLANARLPRRSAVLCALAALAVGVLPATVQARPLEPKTVVVLVDLSDSTTAHREQYLRDFRVILDALTPGDALLVSRIVKAPSDRDPLPIALRLEAAGWLDNARLAERKATARKVLALIDFERLLAATDRETPILEVLGKLPRWFVHWKNPRQVVVLMSDMREYTPGTLNLERQVPAGAAAASAAVGRLQAAGMLTPLPGVRIYVAGARDADARRLAAVRGFWAAYFQAAAADFSTHRYAEKLEAFAECDDTLPCANRFLQSGQDGPLREKEADLRAALSR